MARQIIVIGGGAAGFFCAVNAARINPDIKIILLEKSARLLSKVRISGGGRCNITYDMDDIEAMSRQYPRGRNFVKKAFHKFFTRDTIRWFGERGVKLKTEPDGRMFPVTDSSQTVIDCLMREAEKFNVSIITRADVIMIRKQDDIFRLTLSGDREMKAYAICVATGGYPRLSMFHWNREISHNIIPPVASLFTFNLPRHPIVKLMGVAVPDVRIKITGTGLEETGSVLITHWGLSGPAVLRLSAWGARELHEKEYCFDVHIKWTPDESVKENAVQFRQTAKTTGNHPLCRLPARLWEFLLEQSGISVSARYADIPSKSMNLLLKNLLDYVVQVRGKTTFREEFVTAGGVDLREVDPNTMMSKKIKDLYFAGEVLDVDGITGGFNFQHAWTSGFIAAGAMASASGDD